MAHAEREVIIDRPVSETYDFLADGLNVLKWRPGVERLDLAAGKADIEGTVYFLTLQGPGGVGRVSANFMITKVVRDRELGFEVISGLLRPKVSFRFAVSGQGTRLLMALDEPLTGAKRVLSPVVTAILRRETHSADSIRWALEQRQDRRHRL